MIALLLVARLCVAAEQPIHLRIPNYIARGNEVEQSFRLFTKRLSSDYRTLRARIVKERPALLKKLEPAPAKPLEYGYQLVGQLIPNDLDELRKKPHSGMTENSYSWPLSRDMIDKDFRQLQGFHAKLGRSKELESLVEEYRQLKTNRDLAEGVIQYNRMWQGQIGTDRRRFDEINEVYESAKKKFPNEKTDKYFHRAADTPKFIRVEHPNSHLTVLRVPLTTDIEDARYVKAAKAAIEKFWEAFDHGERFKVELEIKQISPAALYGKQKPPARGAHLDLPTHVRHFPAGAAVLTSGAATTYMSGVDGIPFVTLAQSTAEITLAHEFGHLLGLHDMYLRGYKDLGNNGFEVIEMVPDHWDLMCAPGEGLVQHRHFEQVIKNLDQR